MHSFNEVFHNKRATEQESRERTGNTCDRSVSATLVTPTVAFGMLYGTTAGLSSFR